MPPQKSDKNLISRFIPYIAAMVLVILNPVNASLLAKKKKKSTRAIICAFISLCLALVLGGNGLYDYIKTSPLELRGKHAFATITSADYIKNKNEYNITYRFSLNNAGPVNGAGRNSPPTVIGSTVEILYLPDDPTWSLPVEDLEARVSVNRIFIEFITGFFIFASMSFYATYRYYSHRKQ
jgi:hypothetical protein